MEIKRGDIYWINESEYRKIPGSCQAPNRPAIIVSNDANNSFANTLEIVYLTTAPKKDLPTHCIINSAIVPSTALCEQVSTISIEQIGRYIGTCTDKEMKAVNRRILISLGMEGYLYLVDDFIERASKII
ncbi:MAG: type II toxin-antitoxin system PemK/MazF family toxin [Oscillospiraceae bacterium]|nr:type II toxin-antitoxin system PemK/MazF family toxin [Oscillospiraceae bacterium]